MAKEEPQDVSSQKIDYDIESQIPQALREKNGAALRFIEVKGRDADAKTVTITRNEILTALNMPDEFILAMVLVKGEHISVIYLKNPFHEKPDFAEYSSNYKISKLFESSEVILEKDDYIKRS
jgi:hypothetical protein